MFQENSWRQGSSRWYRRMVEGNILLIDRRWPWPDVVPNRFLLISTEKACTFAGLT
jgi:hypothetical protein